jgi:hypothetical protein
MKMLPLRLLAFFAATSFAAAAPQPVQVNWLGNEAPPLSAGVSFGVPWPRGAVSREQAFSLTTAGGKTLPAQTWPLAYWPDGSVKWTGVATHADAREQGPFTLGPAAAPSGGESKPADAPRVIVRKSDVTWEVDTGRLRARIPFFGHTFLRSLSVDGREVGSSGALVLIAQQGPDDPLHPAAREEYFGNVEKVTVEQQGPVRAVVKIEGRHQSVQTGREWLPFIIRLYFTAGEPTVRMVHTIIYDGDQHRDFIRGLGVRFAVPLREQVHNRHVRLAGEGDGLWSEPVQPLVGRGGRIAVAQGATGDLYPKQIAGERVPNREQLTERSQTAVADWAVWGGFKLTQLSADGFTVEKRTNPHAAWIAAGKGRRASGLVFVGDVSGGLGLGVKDFWQTYPKSLEVEGANTAEASVTAWLWSPAGEAMDLRYYDTIGHGSDSTYEGGAPTTSDPLGVGRTHELTLFAWDRLPTKPETAAMARLTRAQPVLVCTPEYLHSVRALGFWSLPDRSTPFKKAVEERLDSVLAHYEQAVEVHGWYGFWDFGDVIHSYDPQRHKWRYDLGGMAWQNSELATDMWLWMSFLRSGRADLFRLAEAMTRHTGEVDSFHLGPLAGLGTRHNVRHWGLSAKEARVSQAAYRRFYYYLTTDERTGDIMHEMLQASDRMLEYDAMRGVQPTNARERALAPTRVRFGPDWLALVSNWMTEWERTSDPKWLHLITTGMDSIAKMKYGIRTGRNLVMGFDPKDGRLVELDPNPGIYNLATIMGGAEVMFEVNELVDKPEWQTLWDRYLRLYEAPRAVLERDVTTNAEGADGRYLATQQSGPRLASYLYFRTKNPAFAKVAIRELVRRGVGPIKTQHVTTPDALESFDEYPGINTNYAGQAGLDAIETLEFCHDQLPVDVPPLEGTAYERF